MVACAVRRTKALDEATQGAREAKAFNEGLKAKIVNALDQSSGQGAGIDPRTPVGMSAPVMATEVGNIAGKWPGAFDEGIFNRSMVSGKWALGAKRGKALEVIGKWLAALGGLLADAMDARFRAKDAAGRSADRSLTARNVSTNQRGNPELDDAAVARSFEIDEMDGRLLPAHGYQFPGFRLAPQRKSAKIA